MSEWTYVSGVIVVNGWNEYQLISNYELFDRELRGTEGGLDISFTRKKLSIPKRKEYRLVEDVSVIDTMVIKGNLRNVSNSVNVVDGLFEFIERVAKNGELVSCSFHVDCTAEDYMTVINQRKNGLLRKDVVKV